MTDACECGGDLEELTDDDGRAVGKCEDCGFIYYIAGSGA